MTAVRRHRDPAKRAELLAAAARSFATRAFDEVSMDDIAADAGVAKGLLFYYFGSKRRCYLAVIADFHEQLFAKADLSSELSPEQLFSRTARPVLGLRRKCRAGLPADHERRTR